MKKRFPGNDVARNIRRKKVLRRKRELYWRRGKKKPLAGNGKAHVLARSFVRSPPLGPICALSHTLTLRLRSIAHFDDFFNKLVADLIAEILKDLLRLSLEYLDRSRQNPRNAVLSLSLFSLITGDTLATLPPLGLISHSPSVP